MKKLIPPILILVASLLVVGVGYYIQTLNKEIESKDVDILFLHSTVSSQNSTIASQNSTIVSQDKDLASRDNVISSLKSEIDILANTPIMGKRIFTKRLWAGAAMNNGDWKMYFAQDSFEAPEDLLIVGFDFSSGICGLAQKRLEDGEYHGYAELTQSPEWGQSGRLGFVGLTMVITDGVATVEVFEHINVQFQDGNYIDFPKGNKLFLHFVQTSPVNGNSTFGFDATIYYVKRYKRGLNES